MIWIFFEKNHTSYDIPTVLCTKLFFNLGIPLIDMIQENLLGGGGQILIICVVLLSFPDVAAVPHALCTAPHGGQKVFPKPPALVAEEVVANLISLRNFFHQGHWDAECQPRFVNDRTCPIMYQNSR